MKKFLSSLLGIAALALISCLQAGAQGIPGSPPVNLSGAISTHAQAADPHTGYMLESNIGTGASNYVQLDAGGNLDVDGTVTSGDAISVVDTEYPVWEAVDSNGDVVASSTVECSVLTDGSQVCQIHFYVMSDTPGTLTEEFTIDVSSD
jgi:hypothetical protein